jgi:Flp pilus assembly protein TadD
MKHIFGWLFVALTFAGCQKESTEIGKVIPASDEKFVGDKACASCHEDIYASYKRTGMGRSITAFDSKDAPEQFGNAPVYDEKNKLYYEAFTRNDSLFQREFRKDSRGKITHERIEKADMVVGSGHATRSYMMNVNGYFYEMPLTWYVQRKKWDLSPGYHQNNARFDRAINNECMTCHNGFANLTEGTQNHFTNVPMGITCERCHGAGGKHSDARLAEDWPKGKADPTIINPKRLNRNLQLSVCQQCHVDGTVVFAEGQTPVTFRAGILLSAHRTIFADEGRMKDPEQFGIASHGSRLAQSKCYQLSQMTCTTCHDPHRPVQELGASYFNDRCVSCHGKEANQKTCVRGEAKTNVPMQMTGNCVSCHIQKSGTSDIPHVTFTDHWIRRTLPPSKGASSPEAILKNIEMSQTTTTLVRVLDVEAGKGEGSEPNTPQTKLEAAVAYFNYYELRNQNPAYLPIVIRYAQEGFNEGGNLKAARLDLGRAYLEQGNYTEAIKHLTKATQENPNDVFGFYWLGFAQEKNNDTANALASYQKAASIQPKFIEARTKIADLMSQSGQSSQAILELESVLRLNPKGYPSAWNNLGMLYLQNQEIAKAENAFRKSVALAPDKSEALVNLASSLLMQQKIADAVPYLEHTIEIDPKNAAAHGNLGFVYMTQGNKAKAKQMFQKLLSINPNDERAQAYLKQM